MSFGVALFALAFDVLFDLSQRLFRAVDHPVRWIGRLIVLLENRMNDPAAPADERRRRGVALTAIVVLVVLVPTAWFTQFNRGFMIGWIVEALFAAVLLASRELARAVTTVADRLDVAVASGREAVSHIVGRDTRELDAAGVARAAIESLAENTSDGVVAPLFWLALFGLPGIAVYKAVNTADSMIGHRDGRYRDFGWAAARLDDVLNWIPARLTALLMALAAAIFPGADAAGAWRTAQRDAPGHASPNAGWPEAALAGALGFGLGGPRSYGGVARDLPAMGDGRRDLGPADIRRAVRFYWLTVGVLGAAVTVIWLLLPRF